ncbi:LAAT1 protein, partial [Amia calva]|nr:LAAT1 protein [Amia calva]
MGGGVLVWGTLALGENFTSVCPNGSAWVMEVLGECSQDGRDMASVVLGLLSIVCFGVSSIPQYVSSWHSGNMDRALSVWFLLLWLGGDSCNLIGSFLANQLPLQKYTAIYYVLNDLLILSWFAYYKIRNRNNISDFGSSTAVNALGVSFLIGVSISSMLLPQTEPHIDTAAGVRGRTLLSIAGENNGTRPFTTEEIVGFVIGSVSSVLYLFSRLPQIYTNFKRASTKGVSYFLFALVILGNTLYGVSVLLKNPDRSQSEGNYILHHLPWLIGSLGTLSLDIVISFQFLLYRKSPQKGEESEALLGNGSDT